MSTNCVKCGKKGRNNPSLMCTTCEAAEWTEKCDKMLEVYPPLDNFMMTWGKHCGASPETFLGQLCRMLIDCWQIAGQKIKEDAMVKVGTKIIEDCTGIELLYAMSPMLEEDVLMALRFLYYVKAYSAIPDDRYDQSERHFINREDIEDSPLMNPGSDNADDYPERTRALGFYIMLVTEERRRATA